MDGSSVVGGSLVNGFDKTVKSIILLEIAIN